MALNSSNDSWWKVIKTAIDFGMDIHGPKWMNPNDFDHHHMNTINDKRIKLKQQIIIKSLLYKL